MGSIVPYPANYPIHNTTHCVFTCLYLGEISNNA